MKKLKILYVTGMCAPLQDIMTGKYEDQITGTPGFFHPWYKLVKKGHQVDFIILSNFSQKVDIKVDWFSEENIIVNIYDPYTEASPYLRIIRRVKRFFKLIYYTNKALKKNNYDFVYCKSLYEGLAGNLVANWRGVPCGLRSLGTMLYSDINNYGVLGAVIRNPFEFLTFRIKKEFFLMTDDGTNGDIVYQKLKSKKKRYDFYFWKTGISFDELDRLKCYSNTPKHDYIFFAARFDPWKRHDKILNILKILHSNSVKIHLYLAGNVTSKKCFDDFIKDVEVCNLSEYVHFLGSLNQNQLKLFSYYAVANPLMYDYSNLGNVFFEIFSSGSVVIGLNDGSLNDFIMNGENGFLIENEEDASIIIQTLIVNKDLKKRISENAINSAKINIMSIDERFDMEVELIEKTVATSKI